MRRTLNINLPRSAKKIPAAIGFCKYEMLLPKEQHYLSPERAARLFGM
jgi:hypothetical protein